MAAGDVLSFTAPISPSKLCYSFIGGDNDAYVGVDAFTAARVAAGDTTGTFATWIMTNANAIGTTMTIIGNGDANVVEFLDISIEAGLLTVRCTDNTTAQFITQADGYEVLPYQWTHVAVVQAADGYGPKIYVNGKQIAATNDTATNVDAWYSALGGLDSGLIGASNKSGNDSITQEFQGFIGEVKYWNSALTAEQIEKEYLGNASGVATTAHWLDQSTPAYVSPTSYAGSIVNEVYVINGNAFSLLVKNPPPPAVAPVVADDISISISNDTGTAVIIKAA